jgi:acyl-CoA thioester hydrolase
MDSRTYVKEPKGSYIIRFQDCDPFGHLYNSRYIDYFLNAREEHLIREYDLDIYERQKRVNENWVVTKHQIAYLYPAFFREEVIIQTCLLQYTDSFILMEGLMLDNEEKRLKSVVWTSFRHFSLAEGKTVKHPDHLMSLFKKISMNYEGAEANGFDSRVGEIRVRFRQSH